MIQYIWRVRIVFCCAPPCLCCSAKVPPPSSAWQHVPPCIRWTSEQWPQPGAGGAWNLKLERRDVCVCVCETVGQRQRATGPSSIWIVRGWSQTRQKTCVISISLLAGTPHLDPDAFQSGSPSLPGYASGGGTHQFWECEMSHYEVCKTIPPFFSFWGGGVGWGALTQDVTSRPSWVSLWNDPAQTDLGRARFHEAKQDNANRPAGGMVTNGMSLIPLLRGKKIIWTERHVNLIPRHYFLCSVREVNVLLEWSLKDTQHSRFVASHGGQTPHRSS